MFLLISLVASGPARAADQPIDYTEETLDNGLRVIYAPLRQAPVVHVRVAYHVGSKDERPDRQGFAHMFEHMMFRGSAHVRPLEHFRLAGMVGGEPNAFTDLDWTVYHQSVPANQLDLAMWLEADRMASFRITEDIYKVEREVVAEEWRVTLNTPYKGLLVDLQNLAFVHHPYRWQTIGNMGHLRAAPVEELQDFYNRFYLPNNAALVVAGDFDPAAARATVRRYFGWIPRGPATAHAYPAEPAQDRLRRVELARPWPLVAIWIGYPMPPYRADDIDAMAVAVSILGSKTRLHGSLVTGKAPLCADLSLEFDPMEDRHLMQVKAKVLEGKDAAAVEEQVLREVAEMADRGPTPDELASAKTRMRLARVNRRLKAEDVAHVLAQAAVFAGDPARVNGEATRVEAVTAEDVRAIAQRYFRREQASVVRVVPDPTALGAAATQPTAGMVVAPSTRPAAVRDVAFPKDYPATQPVATSRLTPKYQKGTELQVEGVRVIVLPDHRLPLVHWELDIPRGADADPPGKEGLNKLTAHLMGRGTRRLPGDAFGVELQRRAISLACSDWMDVTFFSGSCPTDQTSEAVGLARQMLREPAFEPKEFADAQERLSAASLGELGEPANAADFNLMSDLFRPHPRGRHETPKTLAAITLADVRDCYRRLYRPNGCVLLVCGDVTVEQGAALARELLTAWEPADPKAIAALTPDYKLPPVPVRRRIVLIDQPGAAQAVIRIGATAYDKQAPDRFAGEVLSAALSAQVYGRLDRVVRAELGLAYNAVGSFTPERHCGMFTASSDTKVESTVDTVKAILKVFEEVRSNGLTASELADAKLSVVGGMVMRMQTIRDQMIVRADALLDGRPADYFDRYPGYVDAVTADQVRAAARQYLDPDRMVIVVVAPAEAVRPKLADLGEVEVRPMPLVQDTPITRPPQ